MSKQELYNKIIEYLKRYKPLRIGVFGSFARGEERADSDIDLLVAFAGMVGL